MSNRNELKRARRKAAAAVHALEQIEALPRRVGSQVVWTNGVTWTRVGDDAWTARSSHDLLDPNDPDHRALLERRYPSEHVATVDGGWTRL